MTEIFGRIADGPLDGWDEGLRALFTRADQAAPDDVHGIPQLTRELVMHVQELCALRAEYGDCTTGLGCVEGYAPGSKEAKARREAAADIRKLRFGPDYQERT